MAPLRLLLWWLAQPWWQWPCTTRQRVQYRGVSDAVKGCASICCLLVVNKVSKAIKHEWIQPRQAPRASSVIDTHLLLAAAISLTALCCF
jgi:hypothetical protein